MQEGQNHFPDDWLYNPAKVTEKHHNRLDDLAREYPASGFIHALLARSLANAPAAEKALSKAAVYSADREALYLLIHEPGKINYEAEPLRPPGQENGPVADEGYDSNGVVPADIPGTGEQENEWQNEQSHPDPDLVSGDEKEPVQEAVETFSAEDAADQEVLPEENRSSAFIGTAEKDENNRREEELSVPEQDNGQERQIPVADDPLSAAGNISVKEAWLAEVPTDDRPGERDAETTAHQAGEQPETRPEEMPAATGIDEEVYEEIAAHQPVPLNTENTRIKEAPETIQGQTDKMRPQPQADKRAVFFTPQKVQPGDGRSGWIDEEIFEEISEAPVSGNLQHNERPNPEPAGKETDSPQNNPSVDAFGIESVIPASEMPYTDVAERNDPDDASFTTQNPARASFNTEPVIPDLEQPAGSKPALVAGQEILPGQNTQNTQPSRYHDEKMPYSFMWWLDKTRREHAQTYQPYAAPASAEVHTIPAAGKPPLEQQYIEHIFHLRSVEELDRSTETRTVPFSVPRRDDRIVEKFIREEPQISTPRPEKLDTENKARKSTEDKLEMVSETLAKIYTEQMLYHKAIDTYQKLRLKYPDKSPYFAARIKELEDKTR